MGSILSGFALLSLLGSACGPVVATPVPEPPVAFDISHVKDTGMGVAAGPISAPEGHMLSGDSGGVPARAKVRITNLDTTLPVAAVNADAEGGFLSTVNVNEGQELRFEWVTGDRRSAPADAFYNPHTPSLPGFELEASPRFGCLKVDPMMALDFTADGSAELTIENRCASPLTLDNPRKRLSLPNFSLETPLPLSIEPGKSTSLRVTFARSPATIGLLEDVLFVDINDGSQTIRYPFTLRAE